MKTILIIDIPEDFDYRKCSVGGDGNIYYERKGEQRTSIIGNIKNLKPIPQKFDDELDCPYGFDYMVGWNDCLDELLGDTK